MQVDPFNVAIAPDTPEVRDVTKLLAQTLACSLPDYSLHWDEIKGEVNSFFEKIAPQLYSSSDFQYSDLIGLRSFSERFLTSQERSSETLIEACKGEQCYKNESCWGMFQNKMRLYSSEEELIKRVGWLPVQRRG